MLDCLLSSQVVGSPDATGTQWLLTLLTVDRPRYHRANRTSAADQVCISQEVYLLHSERQLLEV